MGGGLLNLVMEGNENNILNGNPSKTFFKSAYAKYTNFGLQKFRINVEGDKKLNICEKSKFYEIHANIFFYEEIFESKLCTPFFFKHFNAKKEIY